MIVSIHQPAYLPWLGYFERIARSDLHIVLDHVQFEKNSFTNRNRIRIADGWTWLTVPVSTGGRFGELPIAEVEIDNGRNWSSKHWRSIEQNYARTPFFDDHAAFFRDVFEQRWTHLAPLCATTTHYLLDAFHIDTPVRSSTGMDVHATKSELVLELCRQAGATAYLSGALGRDYLDEGAFGADGIALHYQAYRHPDYPQAHGGAFEPFMAAIDLLFNCGPDSRDVLLQSGKSD